MGSCLTYLKKEIRNSIMPKNIKDIDIINSHPSILLNLSQKNNISCNILKIMLIIEKLFWNHLEMTKNLLKNYF